ncbi:DUF6710 family protein [Vibrio sp. 10N.261.46.A3]|uniref:DUF6710 family protein n=1 Tax=Vibrio sp. 10N.261.46.A3 TaxID=3229658 RepID=UPI00354AF7D0
MLLQNNSKFHQIIEEAKVAKTTTPEMLPTLIKLLSRPQQSRLSLRALEQNNATPFTVGDLFHPVMEEYMLDRVELLPSEGVTVDLSDDVVFAWPWNKTRYLENLNYFSDNKVEWVQDYNHSVVLLMPWKVAFVECGNHSIFAGIVHRKGRIAPHKVIDATCLLEKFKTDGCN